MLSIIIKFLKEPLLHFLILASLLFIAYMKLNPEQESDSGAIVVSEAQVNQIYSQFKKLWHRDPTQDELNLAVRKYVLDEIYAQEARNLDLDKKDAVINQRLKQKMTMIVTDVALLTQPTEKELNTFYSKHQKRYVTPSFYTFKLVSLDPNSDEAALNKQIAKQNQRIQKGDYPQGVVTSAHSAYKNASTLKLIKEFGEPFQAQLDNLELGTWEGPIDSGIGIHYVFLEKRKKGETLPFEQVKEKVVSDWRQEKINRSIVDYQEQMLKLYKVKLPTDSSVRL